MPAVIFGIFTALFVVLGVVFHFEKGGFLIAGYNTASTTEKRSYNEKKLYKYVSRMMFLCAACSFAAVFAAVFDKIWLLWLSIGLIIAVCIGGVIFMNTGGRLKRQ